VMQVVTNQFGCADTIIEDIMVVLNPDIPSAFSPDASGQNDEFFVRGGPWDYYELKIYNEWGEQIFKSFSKQDGWDGTKKGVKQPMGVYVYSFYGITINGTVVKEYGDVTLLR